MKGSRPLPATLLAVAAALSALASADHNKDKAFEKLSCSLRRACNHNVSALIDQRDPQASGFLRVQVQRDRRGRVHKSVLAPLRMQGVESVDDGDRWLTVYPDEREVLEEESPLKRPPDDEQRMHLAKKNYSFRIEGKGEVAGRETWRILATPNHEEVDSRRYFIDAETLYPLKMETIRGQETTIEFETVDIKYPKQFPNATFNLCVDNSFKVITYVRPESMHSINAARQKLGFTPIIPSEIPLGFELQETQIDLNPKWRSLVLRLTDGLARATVYEYTNLEGVTMKPMENSTGREVAGIKLLLVSALSEDVRSTILDQFVEQGSTLTMASDPIARDLMAVRELPPADQAFAEIEHPIGARRVSSREAFGTGIKTSPFWSCTLRHGSESQADWTMR